MAACLSLAEWQVETQLPGGHRVHPQPFVQNGVRPIASSDAPTELYIESTIIGIYQPIEEDQVEAAEAQAKSILPEACQDHVTRCPSHVRLLLEQTRQICETDNQFAKLAGLLIAYQDVFSKGDNDVGQTDVMEHFIAFMEGTWPIRQPPDWKKTKR